MRLVELRLHPFGGTADRTIQFGAGATVIVGPNEVGKSTLREALFNALFTPTSLTPVKERTSMGPWYPLPAGDHCRVSLSIDANGKQARVMKVWGAGRSSSFDRGDGSTIADPASVQSALNQLLTLNEATWKSVLFTPQAELARSIAALKDHAHELDDLRILASGSAGIPGDISPDRLLEALQAAVDTAFSKWDMQASRPEKGRGVSNPWINKVGTVLAAYYILEQKRLLLDEVRAHETTVDRVNSELSEAEAALAQEAEFVRTGRLLRNGISLRGTLEERHASLERDIKELSTVAQQWAGTQLRSEQFDTELTRLETEQAELDQELAVARQRKDAAQTVQQYQRIVEMRADVERGRAELGVLVKPDGAQLDELRKLERTIADLTIKIAAQSLLASVDVAQGMDVTVERGANDAESVRIETGTAWSAAADGRFVLRTDALTVSVRVAEGDIDQQIRELGESRAREGVLLTLLQASSLANAEQMATQYRDKHDRVNVMERLYSSALLDRTQEEWDAQAQALNSLPGTREVDVLEKARQGKAERVMALRHEAKLNQALLDGWVERYENVEAAFEQLLTKKGELFTLSKEIEALPQLPEGFETPSEYLNALHDAETRLEDANSHLAALRESRAKLMGKTITETAEELQVEVEHAQRDFDRALLAGNAYLRILDKAKALIDAASDNPLAAYHDRLASAFAFMTRNRYDAVELNGSVPHRVSGKSIAVEPDRLSRGAMGTLALATRMAMAEIYLGEMKGFAIMDDPLTDMDADRRAAAIEFMCEFARTRQLIVLTCHANHASEFAAAGATVVSIG